MENGVWLNEPKVWSLEDGVLEVETDEGTDFWRETHYGFTHDNRAKHDAAVAFLPSIWSDRRGLFLATCRKRGGPNGSCRS